MFSSPEASVFGLGHLCCTPRSSDLGQIGKEEIPPSSSTPALWVTVGMAKDGSGSGSEWISADFGSTGFGF
jgi:hypothetical protein